MKTMTDSMFELETVLKAHAARYPKMEPTDAVKLLYQNEFGGGHLIRDRESCMAYLRREYDGITHDPELSPWEEIGNGVVRFRLAAVKAEELEKLGDMFIRSAAAHTGNLENFLQKLDILRKVTAAGVFAFDSEELEAYLEGYAAAGYPMVSHSEAYRQAYRPAYRVVLAAFIY